MARATPASVPARRRRRPHRAPASRRAEAHAVEDDRPTARADRVHGGGRNLSRITQPACRRGDRTVLAARRLRLPRRFEDLADASDRHHRLPELGQDPAHHPNRPDEHRHDREEEVERPDLNPPRARASNRRRRGPAPSGPCRRSPRPTSTKPSACTAGSRGPGASGSSPRTSAFS